MGKTIVLALGGNAIIKADEKGTWDEQKKNIGKICSNIAALLKQGHKVIITHGNGPQAGNILIQNEMSRDVLPVMPLDVIVAKTQGAIGYAIAQNMTNYLAQITNRATPVAVILTQVVVDASDSAFQNPTKFIGPFFSEQTALEIMKTKNLVLREDSNRGWRRVVPSPEPVEIVEKDIIRILSDAGMLVVAVGGGGIPVVREQDGFAGVEAVVDKDRSAQRLAQDVDADALFLLTDVERVCINYGKPNQKELVSMTVEEAQNYQADHQFPAGSMGPKIEAAVRFAQSDSRREAFIVSFDNAHQAFDGLSGTRICL